MNEQSLNDINVQVFQLLEDLYSYGMKSSPRGHKVVEANVASLDIDPTRPFMEFSDRKFNWKYFAGEVAWYLSKDNRIDFIDKFSKFWSGLTDTGKVNSNYGTILLGNHPSTEDVNQLEWVYNSLVKDKDSRQAVAFLNCPHYQYPGNRDFVCTMYLNFWIRHDRLDMKVQMRSNDIFFGLSYDAPWFAMLHQSMYLNLKQQYPELQLGMYYHCADNIHYYERHFELVDKILKENPSVSPKMTLKYPLFDFENGKLRVSEHAEALRRSIESASNSQSMTDFKKSDWKSLLSSLVIIEEASPTVI